VQHVENPQALAVQQYHSHHQAAAKRMPFSMVPMLMHAPTR
jgi:hypothetical protein